MAESGVCVEPSSTKSEAGDDKDKERTPPMEAVHNFIQGKRHLLVQDYKHAVSSLEKACELYVQHYGQTAKECAEIYFHYGKALFRLSQQEAGVLGDVLPEGSNDEDEAEDDEEEKQSGSEEENEPNESGDAEDSEEVDGEKDGSGNNSEKAKDMSDEKNSCDPEPTKSNSESVTEATTAESKPGEHSGESSKSGSLAEECKPSSSQSKPEAEEDITDLQLAWETLETAKSIFKKQGEDNREAQLSVAETLLILAEISMESENYPAAIDDLNECLKIHKRYLEPDDRLLAETYYQMGLVYTFDNQYSKAIESFQKTMDVLQLRIGTLRNQPIQKSPDGFDINPADEIAQLEALIPEIKAKLEDVQDAIQDTKKKIEELAFQKLEEELGFQKLEMSSSSSSSSKPITDISHLLKRKKPEEQDNANETEVKKIKLNSCANGEEKVSPDGTADQTTEVKN